MREEERERGNRTASRGEQRRAGWGKRPRLPWRPATNCRRPRLRAARYSRRSVQGGNREGETEVAGARRTQPPRTLQPFRVLGAACTRSRSARFRSAQSRRMNSKPVCRSVCESSAESLRCERATTKFISVTGRSSDCILQ